MIRIAVVSMAYVSHWNTCRAWTPDRSTTPLVGHFRITTAENVSATASRITSVRGLRGGYSLARAPEQITVADIVDALEERPFGLTECSANDGLCGIEDGCGIRAGWLSINDLVRRALEGMTLADMIRPLPRREQRIDPNSIRITRSISR